MTRWEPNARGRLEQAAMELFAEHGYDQTTVAQIAERAGLTERTFFRQFQDKREILFAGGSELQELVVAAVRSAPESSSPLEAAVAGVEAAGSMIEGARGRSFARQRHAIISSSSELQERELHKLALMGEGIAEALRTRGVADPGASVLAEVAASVFRVSFTNWVGTRGGPGLIELMHEAVEELRALTAGQPLAGARG